MEETLLSTTEVAKLLSVTPDTVLKWVKNGKMKSFRTPGGHSRIPQEQVAYLLGTPNNTLSTSEKNQERRFHQYCWELLAQGSEIKDKCKDCITYRSRARRCYELRDIPGNLGCLRMYCETSCENCDYFKLIHGSKVNVLIISMSNRILKDKNKLVKNPLFNVEFAQDEYNCSLIIEKFRPDFIIVDTLLGSKRTSAFCNYFFNDSRIPVTRIIVASRTKQKEEYCDKEIFGWLKKPFTVQELKDCIAGVTL